MTAIQFNQFIPGRKPVARVTSRVLSKSKVGFVKEGGNCGHYVILTELKIMADFHGEVMNLLDLQQLYMNIRVQ